MNNTVPAERNSPAAAPLRRRVPWVLLLVAGVPLVLLGAAYFLYATGLGLPTATSNRGLLIKPPLPLAELMTLRTGSGEAAPSLSGHWTILIPPGAALVESLYISRQAHAALGGDAPRVQRVYLKLGQLADAPQLQRELRRGNTHLKVYHGAARQWRSLLQRGAVADAAGLRFFLVDPRGFLFMYYTGAHDGGDLLKDLKFLLRYDRLTQG